MDSTLMSWAAAAGVAYLAHKIMKNNVKVNTTVVDYFPPFQETYWSDDKYTFMNEDHMASHRMAPIQYKKVDDGTYQIAFNGALHEVSDLTLSEMGVQPNANNNVSPADSSW